MSHPLRNMMCLNNVPGEHTDDEAMDWAVSRINDLRDEVNRAWGLNNSLVTQVAMISGANEQLRAAREEAERDATFQYKDKLGERAMRMVQEKCVEHLKEQLAAKDARIAELERLAEYEADLVKLNTVEGATGAKA